MFQRLEDVEQTACLKPYVILEATGHYHHAILTSLEDRGYVTIVVNPLTSQRSKKSSLRKVKTDAQDASHLAQLFYKEEFEPYKKKGEQLFNLRVLTRHHEAMTAMYVQLKLQFHAILDQTFPLFHGTFSDLFSKTALEILRLNVRSKSITWARERAKK